MEVIICHRTNEVNDEQLTELLHLAYGEWREKNINFSAASQTVQETKQRLQGMSNLVAFYDGKLVGTISYSLVKNEKAFFCMFAVRPEYKNQKIGSKLLSTVEKIAFENNVEYITMDTSKRAKRLIKLYVRRGYLKRKVVQYSNTNYTSMVFRKYIKAKARPFECMVMYMLSYVRLCLSKIKRALKGKK